MLTRTKLMGSIAIVGLAIALIPQVNAQNSYIQLQQGDGATISGEVTAIRGDILTVRANNRDYEIDTDDIDLDTNLENYLSVGSYVAAEGLLDDDYGEPELEAKELYIMDGIAPAAGSPNYIVVDDD